MMFDRLVLMHEGHLIYQGPTKELTQYLETMSITPSKFINIADFIITMTQAPLKVRFNLTIKEL